MALDRSDSGIAAAEAAAKAARSIFWLNLAEEGSDAYRKLQSTAANIIVGMLRSDSKKAFFQTPSKSLEDSMADIYSFLGEVAGSEDSIVLNATRVGIVHGALLAFATDMGLHNGKNEQRLRTGITAGSKNMSAAAAGGVKGVAGPAGDTLGAPLKQATDLLDQAIASKASKLQAVDRARAQEVIESFALTVQRNTAETTRYIPSYYKRVTEADRETYSETASETFKYVSRDLVGNLSAKKGKAVDNGKGKLGKENDEADDDDNADNG